jgi:carbon storage regulator
MVLVGPGVYLWFFGSAINGSKAMHGGVNMLVLTRRVGEEIVIDGNIRVMVVAVNGDKIRLGIVAPSSVTVDRKEVHDRRAEFAFPSKWTQPCRFRD